MPQQTVPVFADQLHRSLGARRDADPAHDVVLLVESEQKISGRTSAGVAATTAGNVGDVRNPRVARRVRAFDRLTDAARIPARASEMRAALGEGRA
jgi:hypothetical protein